MSDISLKKPFKHFATNALFYASKVATDATNTSYIQNGEIQEGTPDILWENTVFIHDIAQIWNRGRYYNSQKYLGTLATISKNAFQMYSGMTIVTLVDKNPESMNPVNYADYPGILPSIVVAPGAVQDINKILTLADKGCDVLSTAYNGTSVYDDSTQAKDDDNYDTILENMIPVEQWLVDHGLFTNCYKYPDASKATGESRFIQRYEEYGLVEASTAVNGIHQDNMLLNGKVITDANVGEAIYEIGHDSGNLLIYILNDLSSANIAALNEAIANGVDEGDCIYMQLHEALQMRGSEFNIGRSESNLPFRVYKDGKVDAQLTGSSLTYLAGEALSYNSTTGKLDTNMQQILGYIAENFFTYMDGLGYSFLMADR